MIHHHDSKSRIKWRCKRFGHRWGVWLNHNRSGVEAKSRACRRCGWIEYWRKPTGEGQ